MSVRIPRAGAVLQQQLASARGTVTGTSQGPVATCVIMLVLMGLNTSMLMLLHEAGGSGITTTTTASGYSGTGSGNSSSAGVGTAPQSRPAHKVTFDDTARRSIEVGEGAWTVEFACGVVVGPGGGVLAAVVMSEVE